MCDCIDQISPDLIARSGHELNTAIYLRGESPRRAGVAVVKHASRKRGQQEPFVTCTYCPFCGEPYPDLKEDLAAMPVEELLQEIHTVHRLQQFYLNRKIQLSAARIRREREES